MDKKKLRYLILTEIDKGNVKMNQLTLEVSKEEFEDTLEFLHDEKYIKGYEYNYDGPSLSDAKITEKGEIYLKDNSVLNSWYKHFKELRSWLS